MTGRVGQKAFKLYKPPFHFKCGYIFDSEQEMVLVLEVHGWGMTNYYNNAEALQDEVGKITAEALTEAWNKQEG